MAASTTLISSTPSRAFSSKSTPLVASSSISKPISQTLTFPKSLNGLRLPRVAHSVSLSRGAHSRRSFLVKASADELPLVGNVAPDFEAEAVFDQEFIKVKLSEYIGKKYVILFFYPLDFTFVCPTEITAFSDRHAEFEQLNTEILGVSVDSVFSHLAWVQTDRKSGGLGDLNYPLISDVTKSISKSYGVLIPDQGIALRGLFIIDKEGVIQHSTINNLAIGRSVDETKRTLQALQYVQDNPDDSFHSLHPPNPKSPHFPILSTKTTLSLQSLKPPSSPTPHSDFQEKVLYLDSIGLDFFSLINHHASILSSPLPHIKSTVHFLLTSIGFTSLELRRLIGMCPEILSSRVAEIVPVLTFLLREARVNGSDLRRVLNRRPRLLTCCVKTRLRPTLYFLQSIGISQVNKHTSLLSCSVEDKLQPRIDYLEKIGFSRRDALSMFRRFPQLFCYSIEQNFEPKFNYFVVEMGRDLKELKEFPHYFSFSLENRIRPRHQRCVEKGVCFPLPVLLKTSEVQFRDRLEIFCNSSIPFRNSPLWCTNSISDDLTYSHLNCCVICYL